MAETKIYIAQRREGESNVQFLNSYYHQASPLNTLFVNEQPGLFHYRGFSFVDAPEEADYILIPQGISQLDEKTRRYLDEVRALAQGKKVIVFVIGDLSHELFVDDMVVLKGSQYRRLKRQNEIIVPPYVEDTIREHILLRSKGTKPVVGFCGWADFAQGKTYLAYMLRNLLLDLRVFVTGNAGLAVFKKGIWFRRRAIEILNNSPLVVTNFIVRKTFSGSRKTISFNPAQAREEFIQNMQESDFILAPKGDANYSVRFYEALSMGRISILIDTETCLAGEEYIPYDDFIIRIPWQEMDRLPEIIHERWNHLTPEEFETMQKRAREAFVKYLRYDSFFSRLFEEILPQS